MTLRAPGCGWGCSQQKHPDGTSFGTLRPIEWSPELTPQDLKVSAEVAAIRGRVSSCVGSRSQFFFCRLLSIGQMLESQITPFQTEARRSQRVVARIRVKVIRRDESEGTFSEDTHTLVVNAHGALLMLAMKVRAGEILTLENGVGRDRTHVRVVRLGKKIESKNEVAIEFSSPAPRFWHIDFPPGDWKAWED